MQRLTVSLLVIVYFLTGMCDNMFLAFLDVLVRALRYSLTFECLSCILGSVDYVFVPSSYDADLSLLLIRFYCILEEFMDVFVTSSSHECVFAFVTPSSHECVFAVFIDLFRCVRDCVVSRTCRALFHCAYHRLCPHYQSC